MLRHVLGLGVVVVLAGCPEQGVERTSVTYHESAPLDTNPPGAVVAFSSYLGGNGEDRVLDVAVGAGDHPRIVVVGGTSSSDFVTTDGSTVDTTATAGCAGCPFDAFVTQLAAPGVVRWSTVIGGPGYERATAVTSTINQDVFVGGSAASLPSTATANAADATFAGGASPARGDEDGFVCRLHADTGAIVWCSFLGGTGPGGVLDLAWDPATDGVVAVIATTAAEALDADPAYGPAFAGRHRAVAQGADVVAIELNASGQRFSWATYVGGHGDETGSASVAIDGGGVGVLTNTTSTDAPTPDGFLTAAPAGANAYYAQYTADGVTLRYGTYLGGNGDDLVLGDGLLAEGHAHVAITTTSTDLPASIDASQSTFGGAGGAGCGDGVGDAWTAELNPAGNGPSTRVNSTYFGGSRGEAVGDLARRDFDSRVLVTGTTFSSDLPVSGDTLPLFPAPAGAPCTTLAGSSDGFFAIAAPGQRTLHATYFGGTGADRFVAAAAGEALTVIAGDTTSADFPLTRALQSSLHGSRDGMITVLGTWTAALPPPPLDAGFGEDDGGFVFDDDGGLGGHDDDDGGCGCATHSSSDSAPGLALIALATALALRRRR